MFPSPSCLHQFQSACTSAEKQEIGLLYRYEKSWVETKSNNLHHNTNLDWVLGHMFATLALEPQDNLLSGLCLFRDIEVKHAPNLKTNNKTQDKINLTEANK